MKKITSSLFALLFALLFANTVSASHIPGANITYTCDPNNPLTYTFTLTLFRVCPGTHPPTMSANLFSITNTCGLSNPVIPVFNQVGSAQDINQLCPGLVSSCQGGPSSQPGIWMYTYQATITFPANCNSWLINYDLCCRDASTNTNGGSGNSIYTETLLNTLSAPCNNSSVVTAQPIPFFCAGQVSTYCVTSTDVEGDSLYYVLVSPQGAGGVPITHPAPYSITSPLQNSTFNQQTGCLTFNQPTTGNFVVTIQIQSFDAFGNMTGYVNHDYQIIILTCSNQAPTPPPFITNTSGSAGINGNTIDVCIGDNVCFDVVFADADPLDSLFIITNGTTILPGATFTQTGSNPVTGTFCWIATGGFSGSIVNFSARDQFCPIAGQTSFSVNFNIGTGVFAGLDQIICTGNNGQLQVANATNPVWTSVSGDPIIVGTNISCDTCQNPIITPTQTTTYVVVSDSVVGLCNLTDTITVTVLNATGPKIPDEVICPGPGNFASINVGSGYTNYTWSPACCVGQFANIFNPGTYIVSVDTLVCTMTDTFVVSLAPAPTTSITGIDTVCLGGSTTLNVPTNFTAYSWNPGGQTSSSVTVGAGTYFVTITDTAGCVGNSDTVTVFTSNPQATIVGNNQICLGDETQLSVTPTFSAYQWSNGDLTPTTNAPVGSITVIVTNSFGCNDTVSAVVPSFPAPVATILGADSICPGDAANLSVTPNFATYLWFNNDTNATTTSNGGNVSVVVTDANGCKDTANASVPFFPVPSPNFSVNPPIQGQPGANITFTDLSTANINSWFWTFGDGGSATVQNPTYVYTTQGTFPVTLTVENIQGCINQITIDYLILSDLIIPNVFTPNGDGMNDFLVFKNVEFFENELKVFNRWGREVFSQTNYNNDWDGDDVSDGTYYFILEVKMPAGGVDTFKGTITILK